MNNYKIIYSDTLAHHGILGQKWGERNGPPYPLDYDSHSNAQKSKNSKGSLNNYGPWSNSKGSKRNDSRLSSGGSTKKNSSSNLVDNSNATGNPNASIEFKDKIPPTHNKMTFEELDNISKNINPNLKKDRGYQMNCGSCCMTFELQQRGINAKVGQNKNGLMKTDFLKCFDLKESDKVLNVTPNLKGKRNKSPKYAKAVEDSIKDSILTNFNDSDYCSGAIFCPDTFYSHYFSWVKDGNTVTLYDNQTRYVLKSQEKSINNLEKTLFKMYKQQTDSRCQLDIYRLSECDINYEEIRKHVNI